MKKLINNNILLSNLRIHSNQSSLRRSIATVASAALKAPTLSRSYLRNTTRNGAAPFTTGTMPHPGTLIKPPPDDPNKSPIENVLEVTELAVLGPVSYTPSPRPAHIASHLTSSLPI
jgi:hypothetical protein